MLSFVSFLCLFGGVACLSGCTVGRFNVLPAADTRYASAEGGTANYPTAVHSPNPTPASTSTLPLRNNAAVAVAPASDLDRLAALWRERTQQGGAADFPIGPGDVLEVSVPALEEIKERTVRVAGDGTISLPLVGIIQAQGQTEERLRDEIRSRLEADYMRNPQVNIFVKDYRSRQAAVIGAVEKPGLYNLASGADTLLDLISLAGGMNEMAAPRIHFIPAEPVTGEQARKVAAVLPVLLGNKHPAPLLMKKSELIVIDLGSLALGDSQLYLTLPVRPGDVIMVPGGGDVLIEGWVEKPGSYKITPGLTVLGVVAAAGGSLFAADTSAVKVIRIGKGGEKVFFVADLENIKKGQQPDVPVQEGDVIEVSSSTMKLGPYGLYKFFSAVFHVGVGMSAPIY